MLMVSMGLMFFQDPLLNYFNTWCTYNTWLFNRGSWVVEHSRAGYHRSQAGPPGSRTTSDQRARVTRGACSCARCFCCRKHAERSRRGGQHSATFGLLGITVRAWRSSSTSSWRRASCCRWASIPTQARFNRCRSNAGHYYQWPIYEGLMWGAVETGLASIKFFTDDRERNIHRARLGERPGWFCEAAVRCASSQSSRLSARCFFVFYNIPAQWIGHARGPMAQGCAGAFVLHRGHLRGRNGQAPAPIPLCRYHAMDPVTSTKTVSSSFPTESRFRRSCRSSGRADVPIQQQTRALSTQRRRFTGRSETR